MTVEFEFKKSPAYRVAYIAWTGPWNEQKIRSQFARVEKWAKDHGYSTGRWVFREPGERKWETGIEVRGAQVHSHPPIRLKSLPATRVARAVFDPDVVAPNVIYHGLNDWLRWRKKEGKIRSVVSTREVYTADPWKDKTACARTEVQFVVRP
ncbi:MAG: GyrI-like domain-containing protein [Thermoplasmata archaeon]